MYFTHIRQVSRGSRLTIHEYQCNRANSKRHYTTLWKLRSINKSRRLATRCNETFENRANHSGTSK